MNANWVQIWMIKDLKSEWTSSVEESMSRCSVAVTLLVHNRVVGSLAQWVENHWAEDGHAKALCRQTGVNQEEGHLLTTAASGLVDTVGGDSEKARSS